MTAYNLYCILNQVLDNYSDSILLKEDPSEAERKNYEYIKYWRPSVPDSSVKNILTSISFEIGDKGPTGEKGSE